MRPTNLQVKLLISIMYLSLPNFAMAGPIKPLIGDRDECASAARSGISPWTPPPIDWHSLTPSAKTTLRRWSARLPYAPHFARESNSIVLIGFRGEPYVKSTHKAQLARPSQDYESSKIQSMALAIDTSGRMRIQIVADTNSWFATLEEIFRFELDREFDSYRDFGANATRPILKSERREVPTTSIIYFEIVGVESSLSQELTFELLTRVMSAYFHFPVYEKN